MPGTLPVLNQKAVEFGLRVALALECEIQHTSIFARKNYFYPDLPKGYQISQYEQPLAVNGKLTIITPQGEKTIRIRRVHLEEDTGKLTHVQQDGQAYSLVDLNRAGVPLLEIVTEPDFRSAEDVRLGAEALRRLLRALGVNSGDLEKGVMRIEPNISVRPAGIETLGTKVEIKNLNSFRALERGVAFEIGRQTALLETSQAVTQETVGWDEVGTGDVQPAHERRRPRLPLLPRAGPPAAGRRRRVDRTRCADPCRSCRRRVTAASLASTDCPSQMLHSWPRRRLEASTLSGLWNQARHRCASLRTGSWANSPR